MCNLNIFTVQCYNCGKKIKRKDGYMAMDGSYICETCFEPNLETKNRDITIIGCI